MGYLSGIALFALDVRVDFILEHLLKLLLYRLPCRSYSFFREKTDCFLKYNLSKHLSCQEFN